MIKGLAGTIIWTENFTELLDFYRNVFVTEPKSIKGQFASFDFGETKFGLGVHKNVKGISKEIYRVMINLSTEDIFFEYERLQALGVKFIRIPEKENWGGWIATFLDPDNNVIQMIQQS
ncbi:MAG: VOC family protein [Dehalococcoidia bacterium]